MTKNALTVNQALEQLTATSDDEARAAILNNCTVVQIRRIIGELKLSVPGKLRKSELIQAIIQTIHAPETEALAPISPEQAINFSSTDNPLHDIGTPAPIRATSLLHGDVTGTQLHAAHVHDGQEDVKQFHSLAVREKTSRRTIERDSEPWFVAADVCAVLGLTNSTEALKALDDDERGSLRISEGTSPKGGNPNMNIISESGLYTLIMRSNKPEARAFRKWVTGTVLPAIRKYGRYEAPRPAKAPKPKITMSSARMVLKEAGLRGNQLALALDKYVRHYTGDSVLAICGVSLESPSPRQLLTPTEIGAELGLSNQKVNKLLQDAGYQLRLINGTWEPTDVGQPWFVAKDVCAVLGIVNSRDAIKVLDDDEKMTIDNSEGHSGQRIETHLTFKLNSHTPNRGKAYHVIPSTFKIAAPLSGFCTGSRVVNRLELFEAVLRRFRGANLHPDFKAFTSRPERQSRRVCRLGFNNRRDNSRSDFVCQLPACPVDPISFCAFGEYRGNSPGTRRNTMMNFKNGP